MLKPQDVLVALKLVAIATPDWKYEPLAESLGLSSSAVHAAVARAGASGLINLRTRRPIAATLLEFLVHGVRYVFPPEHGRIVRGMMTGPSAPPLSQHLTATEATPLVWPFALGEDRGESLKPLYDTVPEAAGRDPNLYALLVVVDGIRVGGARVRAVAADVLKGLLDD